MCDTSAGCQTSDVGTEGGRLQEKSSMPASRFTFAFAALAGASAYTLTLPAAPLPVTRRHAVAFMQVRACT